MRHASSRFTLEVYTQAKVKAKREAQQRIVEMMLPEEGLAEIRLQQRQSPEFFGRRCEVTKIVRGDSNGVFWCHGKFSEWS